MDIFAVSVMSGTSESLRRRRRRRPVEEVDCEGLQKALDCMTLDWNDNEILERG